MGFNGSYMGFKPLVMVIYGGFIGDLVGFNSKHIWKTHRQMEKS